jgi:integrase
MEQIQACAAKVKNPSYGLLPLFILETGLRWGEAVGILPDAVDLDEGLVHVTRVVEEVHGIRTLREYPKSEAGFRTIPLTSSAVAIVKKQLILQPAVGGKPVFRGARGALLSRNNYRTRVWLPATIDAGVHRQVKQPNGDVQHWPTIHHIRHLWHTRLERAGVPESTRKELMGHERPGSDITWRYTHGADDIRVMVLRALGDDVEDAQAQIYTPPKLRLVG